MNKRTTLLVIVLPIFLSGATAGWALARQQGSPASEHWLSGSPDEKLWTVERHLRGLDQAMAEVGYRFTELFWAGMDQNWEYARYQLDKIELTTRLSLERRPKRAASAAPFLAEEIPAMRAALAKEEEEGAFQAGMARFRSACTTGSFPRRTATANASFAG